MAFFAVIRESDDSFDVLQCHLNLWCLGGLLGRTRFLWDVGLRLRGTSKKTSRICLALPFGTADDTAKDLHNELKHQNTAELVFGNPVDIIGERITYDETPVNLGWIESSRRIADKSAQNPSLWEIHFTPQIDNSTEVYLRMRFHVNDCGQTWVWKRSPFHKTGALIDMRVSDVRETVAGGNWARYRDRIVPIQKLNLLIIAPDYLRVEAVSPPLKYMRLLESLAWENYLGRAPNARRSRRMIIYHWRSDKDIEVNVRRPFLAFLDLGRDHHFVRFGDHARAAVVLLIILGASYLCLPILRNISISAAHTAAAHNIIAALTGSGILISILAHANKWRWIKGVLDFIAKRFEVIENWSLRPRGGG